jgi:hypothetical protein
MIDDMLAWNDLVPHVADARMQKDMEKWKRRGARDDFDRER